MILSAHLMIRRRLRQMFENILIDLIDTDAFADFTKCRRNWLVAMSGMFAK